MDDDWGVLIAWLIGIVVALYCLYWFIVHVLPWILVVGVGVGLPGYGLTRLLTAQRCQLSSRSAIALFFGVGFTAWVTSVFMVSSTGMNPWFSLLIAPSCFYMQGLILLSVWALYRLASGWKQLHQLRRQLKHSEAVVAGLQLGVRMIRLEIEHIGQEHGEQMKKVGDVRKQINWLCAREPRTLGLFIRKEQASVSDMTTTEIKQKLQSIPNVNSSPGEHVRALLLQEELLQRSVNAPLHDMEQATNNLRSIQLRLEAAQETVNQLKATKERCEERFNMSRSRTILL